MLVCKSSLVTIVNSRPKTQIKSKDFLYVTLHTTLGLIARSIGVDVEWRYKKHVNVKKI